MKKEMGMNYKMKKRGLSGIVAAVIMIALVMAIGGVVWVVISNLVSEQLEEAGSCLDVLGKVNINHEFTCYNSTSEEFFISIGIGDITLEKVIIAVSGNGMSKSYEITPEGTSITGVKNYNGSTTEIKLPGKNEGLTYRIDTGTSGLGKPVSVKLYPVVGGKQCDSTDSTSSISSCLLLA